MLLDRLINYKTQEPGGYAQGAPSPAKKPFIFNLLPQRPVFVVLGIISLSLPLLTAQASVLSIFGLEKTAFAEVEPVSTSSNSQTLVLPQAVVASREVDDDTVDIINIADDNALFVQSGPMGTEADVALSHVPESMSIYTYVVRSGDTLPTIAKMFDVSVGTIVWANDLSSKNAKLTPGQVLSILPISGISYTIKKNDTLSSIAKAFKVDADEIGRFNGLESNSKIAVGDKIIIPGAELSLPTQTSRTSTSTTKTNSKLPLVAYGPTRYIPGYDGPDMGGYFIRPVRGCVRTQGLHGAGGVDIACSKATVDPILAAASGTVLIAKTSGWNGGFGNYVVINHPNGTQTLYGHMSTISVVPGQQVTQGQSIGLMGASGRSTGKHLHWEVHGAVNPIGKNPRYGL